MTRNERERPKDRTKQEQRAMQGEKKRQIAII